MRFSVPMFLLFGILGLIPLGADSTPEDTNSPSATTNNLVRSPRLYSFQAPPGWETKVRDDGSSKACDMVAPNDCAAMIYVLVTQQPDVSIDKMAQRQRDLDKKTHSTSDVQASDPQPFTTDSGWEGLMYTETITYNGRGSQYRYYFFKNHDARIMLTMSCHSESADHYNPLFDAAVKSLTKE